jgi:hypothetical protein
MAHFAKIGLNGKVLQVQVVKNEVLHDSNGVEQENIGVNFLTQSTGWAVWKQTSYNGNIRKNFAGVGMTYDEDRDAFIPPKPFNSWVLNETTCRWDPPVERPELTQEQIDNNNYYRWNEENQTWDLV